MGARQRMTMRVTFLRNIGATDAYGHPSELPTDWEARPEVPCYAWQDSGRASYGVPAALAVGTGGMIVPKGTDVTEDDRIATVKDRRGTELFGKMDIDAVLIRTDHLELRIRRHA